MRIPFPERIPVYGTAILVIVLFAVQRIEGTPFYFCFGCALFLLIATVAFNVSGGLTRCSGAYVFFYATLVVIIGVIYKAFLGEPAQSNLADPRTTIEVYVGGISAMLGAAIVSRRLSRRRGVLESILEESQMYRASIGCMIIGAAGPFILGLLGTSGERLQTAFAQMNQLIPLGIIIGVIYEIRRSGGRRSINPFIVIGGCFFFVFYGLFSYSKQGMITAPFCWFLAAWSQKYRFSRTQIVGALMGSFVLFHYLVPFAQYGRNMSETTDARQRFDVALRLLEDPEGTRRAYIRDTAEARGLNSYYNTPQGFWDRLQFISADDALINVTDQGRVFGLLPIQEALVNAVPRVFWPNKPDINLGNLYAHEIGGFSEEDTTTGISFSPTAEAYHMARWTGVLVVAPLIWFILFTVYDSLFGDLRTTPWGLLAATEIAHVAPEGALTGVIHLLTFGVEIFVFCALFATWVAPVVASGLLGPGVPRRFARAAS